ncbi:MAG TPA: hypothetical protein PLF01_00625 [Alphaproteobacteria bacterium]|nr:hypothetical protein [Alphaproteobacteria bacterium]
MADFKTSLLREKFVITSDNKDEEPIIALSNRIVVPLVSADGIDNETFIVRTQNMHSCTRFAAAVAKEFFERGTIANRAAPMSWDDIWMDVIKGYERDWNPDIWSAIYYKGRCIFHYGTHHPFLDIIEQCDAANHQEYAESVLFAEKAFSQAGKKVSIEHDSNIALVISSKENVAKCGIIVRAATGATTFNYTSHPREDNPRPIHVHTVLTVAAAFLEGIQLCFQVGLLNRKQEYKLIEKYSDEDRKHKRATNRLANLSRAIGNYENFFSVSYRPDKPDFRDMVRKAEDFSIKILKPQIEAKIAQGELKADDWVM